MKKTIVVEGNIGSGKSTFLNRMETLMSNIQIVQEPVDEWFMVKDRHDVSLFERFYQEPNKYSFLLQMNILSSRYRTMMNNTYTSNDDDVCLFERSILTDKYVFVPALCDMDQLSKMEFEVFTNVFDSVKHCTQRIDGIIYLQCSPEVSYERILKRNRQGEEGISIDYLRTLHNKHEEWLTNYNDIPVYTLDVTTEHVNYSEIESFLKA